MNTQYCRYALEVEKTGSITQAASNLFMSQPTLSKAIKDMEETVVMGIFLAKLKIGNFSLGSLIRVAGTDDVAAAYAATYPFALVCVVLACQLIGMIS